MATAPVDDEVMVVASFLASGLVAVVQAASPSSADHAAATAKAAEIRRANAMRSGTSLMDSCGNQ